MAKCPRDFPVELFETSRDSWTGEAYSMTCLEEGAENVQQADHWAEEDLEQGAVADHDPSAIKLALSLI